MPDDSPTPSPQPQPSITVTHVSIPLGVVNMVLTYLSQPVFNPIYGVALREIVAHALKIEADASFAAQLTDSIKPSAT